MSRPAGPGEPVSGVHLREAERGFLAMLRAKRFPAPWIEANALDLLAQASSEYAAWLTRHDPEPNPVGWLITCAYRRAINLLEAQRRRPATTSLDAVYDLADEGSGTPEHEALENDRQRRLREALGLLSRQDRRLLSLVYFEDRSVREAGRRMGWRKSAADRHHRAALERLRAIVGEDRSLMSPAAVGLAAWAAAVGEHRSGLGAMLRSAKAPLEAGLGGIAEGGRRLGDAARRMLPFLEPGGAAASGGAGRVVGACGAGLAAAVCGLALAGVEPTLPGNGSSSPPPRAASQTRPEAAVRAEAPQTPVTDPPPGAASGSTRGGAEGPHHSRPKSREEAQRPAVAPKVERSAAPVAAPPPADPVVEEFGIEGGGEPVTTEPAAPTPAPPSTPAAVAPSRTARPAPQASGAQVEEEFGL